MDVKENQTPNDLAKLIAEKHLQGKSYSFVKQTVRYLESIAEITCTLPILKEQN